MEVLKLNNAKSTGGAVFAEACQAIFNNVTFVNNTAEISGGGNIMHNHQI